jgi:hypothetical protein
MALVLDGNGTMTVGNGDITGLATGALPANVIGAGAVLQVVQAYNSGISTTTVGWVDSTLNANITPISSSSKILILISAVFRCSSGRMGSRIVRNTSTVICGQAEQLGVTNNPSMVTYHYLDSPSSTNSTNYRLDIYQASAGTMQTNDAGTNVGINSHNVITLMEIAG